jgi:hypothetical protein
MKKAAGVKKAHAKPGKKKGSEAKKKKTTHEPTGRRGRF